MIPIPELIRQQITRMREIELRQIKEENAGLQAAIRASICLGEYYEANANPPVHNRRRRGNYDAA